tara:strand:- start:346 stop:609 length:264 start_codon:yes stop_codon:yes gene_type:complete
MSGKLLGRIENLLHEKIVQISLVGGILFYILAEPSVFAFVDDLLKRVGQLFNFTINLQGNQLLIFHSLVFSLFLGLSVKYILEPLFV